MNKGETSVLLFKDGFNCSQTLLAAYAAEFGVNRELALKIASAFGGGIGRMGDTCGAVIGALMVIGLKHGAVDVKDKTAKTKTYDFAKEFIERFRSRNESLLCRELLGFDVSSDKGSKPEADKIIQDKCPKFVKDAAEIIEDIL